MGCLASEMESAALFIAGSFLHVRVGACFLVLANQEREKRGLPNVQVHDTTQAIATTVDAIRLLMGSQFWYFRQLLDEHLEENQMFACLRSILDFFNAGWRQLCDTLK